MVNTLHRQTLPRQILLQDDGLIPNSSLPLLIYSDVLANSTDRTSAFEALFASNGWGRSWRNGIYAGIPQRTGGLPCHRFCRWRCRQRTR